MPCNRYLDMQANIGGCDTIHCGRVFRLFVMAIMGSQKCSKVGWPILPTCGTSLVVKLFQNYFTLRATLFKRRWKCIWTPLNLSSDLMDCSPWHQLTFPACLNCVHLDCVACCVLLSQKETLRRRNCVRKKEQKLHIVCTLPSTIPKPMHPGTSYLPLFLWRFLCRIELLHVLKKLSQPGA